MTPDKDFDNIAQIKKTIKIDGKVFEVKRIGVHQKIKFYALQKKMQHADNDEQAMENLQRILDLVDEFVPGLSDSGVSVTEEQLMGIVEFAASISAPEKKTEELESVVS